MIRSCSFSIRFPLELLDSLERNVKEGKFSSVSEAIRSYIELEMHIDSYKTIIKDPKFQTKNMCRETDLVLNKKVHLQHDTVKIHGELGFETTKTLRRNADYERAGLPYIIINEDLAKANNLEEGDLTEYLYYHELSKIQAKEYAQFG